MTSIKARGWRAVAAATWGRPNDPQIYGDLEVDAESLRTYLDGVRRSSGVHVTVTHAVGKALALALAEQPEVNARLYRGRFLPRDSVDIFFAVSVHGGEQVSGVKVERTDEKPLVDIADELVRRAARARGGEADLEMKGSLDWAPSWLLRRILSVATWLTSDKNIDLKRLGLPRQAFGSAMVSSVAMFGVQKAYGPLAPLYRIPILLLVSEIADKAVVVDGELVARPILTLTATMDHRYLDGAHAARLARTVRAYLERPAAFEPRADSAVAAEAARS